MPSTSTAVYRTGQVCPISGLCQFAGYLDGTFTPSPTAEEQQIRLTSGERFPPIKSSEKGCYWAFVR